MAGMSGLSGSPQIGGREKGRVPMDSLNSYPPVIQQALATSPPPLGRETGIVWLEDPGRFRYVRQIHVPSPSRIRRPPWAGAGRMVGYATLGPGAAGVNRRFSRRVFYVR